MNGRVFLDTNILIYAHTDIDLVKLRIAQQLIRASNSVVSTQVLQETANTLHRKFKCSWDEIQQVLEEESINNSIHTAGYNTITQACSIAQRYGYAFYDCMILSAALESGCHTLYSEDLQNNQQIENRVTILNPFL